MFEKVNPAHPDKIADRIAGSIVDLAYLEDANPHIAVEVLIGHGYGLVTIETDVLIQREKIEKIVARIAPSVSLDNLNFVIVKQDYHLHKNQNDCVRCGDNGIFRGCLISQEQQLLTNIAYDFWDSYCADGKYLLDDNKLIVCQSNMKRLVTNVDLSKYDTQINPLGYWTGGTDVDSGATDRKLGSDMGEAITGGGLHGKDLSKADVTLNILAHQVAQGQKCSVELSCAIGDKDVVFKLSNGLHLGAMSYENCVKQAKKYIDEIGGFEKFAEWGLIRPNIKKGQVI